MERLLSSNVSVINGNIKYQVGKLIFAVNLPLQIFRATLSNADTGSLNSLHTLFDKYLDNMLAGFEPNRMVLNVQNFKLYNKKSSF